MTMTLMETSIAERLLGIERALSWHKDNFTIDEINEFLSTPVDEYDFTCFEYPIKTKGQLRAAIALSQRALKDPDTPWSMLQCKCGERFTLTRRETEWYRSTGYQLPTLCPKCVNAILGGDIHHDLNSI